MPRVLIVANRLPVTVRATEAGVEVQRSAGGLATGLLRPHEQSGGLWIGWSGCHGGADWTDSRPSWTGSWPRCGWYRFPSPPTRSPGTTRASPTAFSGRSSIICWIRFRCTSATGTPYAEVNERFADIVAEHYRPGDLIWVHDYQLLLFPSCCASGCRMPESASSFTSRFPSEELFRTLPERDRLLEGLLGADLVGFHTPAYLRHFAASLTQILGLTVEIDRVQLADREVRLGVFPMGIDAETSSRPGQ